MSDEIAIRVENLSKRYIIRHQRGAGGEGLRHVLQDKALAPFRALKKFGKQKAESRKPDTSAFSSQLSTFSSSSEEFWALKGVSFEIKRGEVVGIIGRNGAGKSTLLKILSRITEPTTGRITINGHIASLLEVGTGFHFDLSGRENIYLNGAVLGMRRSEIQKKFDEIVTFAGVEQFLDTPVKRYSTGMYLRLAFAVAAHLDSDILLIDEVLAVGDSEFQKKCLGTMQHVSAHGRTVIFVSHNLAAMQMLCPVSLLLERGSNVCFGKTADVIKLYQSKSRYTGNAHIQRQGNGNVIFEDTHISSDMDTHGATVGIGGSLRFDFILRANRDVGALVVAVEIHNLAGEQYVHSINADAQQQIGPLSSGHSAKVAVELRDICFAPGTYQTTLWVGEDIMTTCDHLKHLFIFEVVPGPKIKRTQSFPQHVRLLIPSTWRLE
jgi:lipopolysaccharide transport system ATP-binding protein